MRLKQQKYKEWLSGLAREGKLSIMQGCERSTEGGFAKKRNVCRLLAHCKYLA